MNQYRPRTSHRLRAVATVLVVGAGLICGGCGGGGGGAPPPEAPNPEVNLPGASADARAQTKSVQEPAGAVVEQGPTNKKATTRPAAAMAKPRERPKVPAPVTDPPALADAAQIRLYLARHQIYRPWYPQVGEIELDADGSAAIDTTLPEQARARAKQICAAVQRSKDVEKVQVTYGRGAKVACG